MIGAMAGRCPACGEPGAFAGWTQLRSRCLRCAVVFERDPGSFLGATVLAYAVATVAMGIAAALTIPGRGLYRNLEWVLLASAIGTLLITYRPIKGWWLWLTWVAGWVHRNAQDPDAG